MQTYVSEDSWPKLPGTSSSSNGSTVKLVKKFSHVVKKELTNEELEQISYIKKNITNIQQTPAKIIANFEKESSQELKLKNTNNLIKKQISKETEKEDPVGGLEPRNHRRKVLLKEEKKRAREEEIRRNLIAPKGQKVRIVDQKMLEVILDNNVSFVNRQDLIPSLTESDFPSVQEARKQWVKSRDSSIEQQTKDVLKINRIKKHKDPVYVDLANLIKEKPRRPQCSTGRVQKRLGNLYTGNQLDASNPERKRGKTKEVPKKKKPSALKCAILEERELRRRLKTISVTLENLSIEVKNEPVRLPIHSRKFREYCDNRVTPRLNEAMKLLLRDVVKFQDRQHQKNPVKAFAKRRYVSGFREVKKHLDLKKVKLVIIAPDLEVVKNKGGIDETVAELKTAAKEQNVMCAFALSRRELGYLTFKKVGISCIGVCSYEGSENNYQEVLAALAEAQESYRLETSSTGNESDVKNEVIASLLSKLSLSESPFLNAIEHKCKSEEQREMLDKQLVQNVDE